MISVCAFGDSIVKGVVLDENSKYRVAEENFAEICRKNFGIRVENAGKFGSTVKVGERLLERFGDIRGYDYALLKFGGNDCDYNWKEISLNPGAEHKPNSTIADFREMYARIIANVRERGVKPVLLSLVPIDASKYFDKIIKGLNADNILEWLSGNVQFISSWHERYNLEVFKIARELDVPLIDITSPFLEDRTSALICEDGIHPNEAGHRIIAESIKQYIEDRFVTVAGWIAAET